MRKPQRRGAMAMEKSSSKYRTQFWYVAMASFLLWLCLLYLFNSSATTVHNHERLFRQENVIDLAAVHVVPRHDHESRKAVVSVVDNSTLPVSGDDPSSPEDRISEDAKAVNDLVEELEKEKIETEKKKPRGDSVPSGRSTRARRGHRESRKARSSGRLEAEKKRVRVNDDDDVESNVDNSDENRQSLDKEPNSLVSDENRQSLDKEPNSLVSDENSVESKKEQVDDNEDLESKRSNDLPNDWSNNDLEGDNTSELVSEPKAESNTTSEAKHRVNPKRNQPRRVRKVMVRPRETRRNDPCRGKYVYMHDVPALFHEELLKNCWTLSRWTDMCELTSNFGF